MLLDRIDDPADLCRRSLIIRVDLPNIIRFDVIGSSEVFEGTFTRDEVTFCFRNVGKLLFRFLIKRLQLFDVSLGIFLVVRFVLRIFLDQCLLDVFDVLNAVTHIEPRVRIGL